MGQALKTPPRTPEEYERQKGPMPPAAMFMVAGLVLAFLAFFGPPLIGTILEFIRG